MRKQASISTEQEPSSKRLFFALWPCERVRAELATLSPDLSHAGGRLVRVENLHMTLAFLGVLSALDEEKARVAAAQVVFEPFVLVLEQYGYFQRPRAVWSGPAQPCEPLHTLSAQLNAALVRQGVSYDERPLCEHLTLARSVRPSVALGAHQPVVWAVENFCLVHSRSNAGVLGYVPLEFWRAV